MQTLYIILADLADFVLYFPVVITESQRYLRLSETILVFVYLTKM